MRTSPTHILAALAVAGSGLWLAAPAAHAGQGVAPQLVVSPSSVEAGVTITIDGAGFVCPGVGVEISIQLGGGPSTPLVSVPSSAINAGVFSVTATAPGTVGQYTVTGLDGECRLTASDGLEVVPPPTTTTTTTTTTTLAPTTTSTSTTTTTLAPTTTAVTTTSLAAAPVVLPATGNSSDATAWTALALLVGGGALLWTARRRAPR
jgi:LPXTG-motif cell wall-anchored protein